MLKKRKARLKNLCRIRIKDVWIFALLFPFVKPELIEIISPVSRAFSLMQYVSYFSILVWFGCYVINKHIIDKSLLRLFVIILYVGYFVMVTGFVGGIQYLKTKVVLSTITLCIMGYLCLQEKSDLKAFLRSWGLLSTIYAVINLAIVVIFPKGISNSLHFYNMFLFGQKNIAVRYLLPGICAMTIADSIFGTNKGTFITIIISMISIIACNSATGSIGIVLFAALYYLLKYGWKNRRIIYFSIAIVVVLVLNYVVLSGSTSPFFVRVFQMLGRNSTASDRTRVWATMLEYIKKRPVLGYGMIKTDSPYWPYRQGIFAGIESGHNYYLDKMYQGGIIGLLMTIVFHIIVGVKLVRVKSNTVCAPLMAFHVAYLVMFLFECFLNTEYLFFPIIYLLAFNVDRLQVLSETVQFNNFAKDIRQKSTVIYLNA